MIAAAGVAVADGYQSRDPDVAQPVSALAVLACEDEMDKLRELRVCRPGQVEEFLDFLRIAVAVILGKESVGPADLVADRLLETHLDQLHDRAVRQARDATRSGSSRRAR